MMTEKEREEGRKWMQNIIRRIWEKEYREDTQKWR